MKRPITVILNTCCFECGAVMEIDYVTTAEETKVYQSWCANPDCSNFDLKCRSSIMELPII